jgi:hypothetical protein
MVQSAQDTATTLSLQTAQLRGDLVGLNHLAEGFGQTIVRSFAGGIIQGRKLSDVLKGLALSLAGQALSSALKPLGSIAGDVLGGIVGNVIPGAAAQASRAPSLPSAPGAASVTVNISTPDAASFRQSQS